MPGLVNPEMEARMNGAQMMPAQSGQMPEETVPDDLGEEATPEEQAAYEEFVKEGFRLMYEGGEAKPNILKMLDDDPSDLMAVLENAEELQEFSPVVALAATAAIIVLQIVRESGEQDGTIILHGGKAILEECAELAQVAGVREYTDEEINKAFLMGTDLFRAAAEEEGLVDMSAAKEEWGEIETADKEGRLGEILPQLAQAAPPEEEAAYGPA